MDTLDHLLPFYLEDATIRGRLVRLERDALSVLERHRYPAIINHYLVELMLLAAALGTDAKHAGTFTLQISGGSIIKLMVVDINNQGHFRACAQWVPEQLEHAHSIHGDALSLPVLFQGAVMMMCADFVNSVERYQTVVALEGHTFTDCIHHYFRQSDQIQTGVFLAAATNMTPESYVGGAVLLQKLPTTFDDDDHWVKNLSFLGTLKSAELLDKTLSSEKLLYRLFHESALQIQPCKSLLAQCSCSRDRIRAMLDQFSPTDLAEMSVNGVIDINCQFCSQHYVFDKKRQHHT